MIGAGLKLVETASLSTRGNARSGRGCPARPRPAAARLDGELDGKSGFWLVGQAAGHLARRPRSVWTTRSLDVSSSAVMALKARASRPLSPAGVGGRAQCRRRRAGTARLPRTGRVTRAPRRDGAHEGGAGQAEGHAAHEAGDWSARAGNAATSHRSGLRASRRTGRRCLEGDCLPASAPASAGFEPAGDSGRSLVPVRHARRTPVRPDSSET